MLARRKVVANDLPDEILRYDGRCRVGGGGGGIFSRHQAKLVCDSGSAQV
jgi:hypothetical protein